MSNFKKKVIGLSVAFLLGITIILIVFAFRHLNHFLSINSAVKAKIMVVEGWIPDYALIGAKNEFEKNGYTLLIAVGGPLDIGSHLSKYKSYARLTVRRLEEMGIPERQIAEIETKNVMNDRTYEAAKAVKHWLALSGIETKNINVYTLGAHARRSQLLFKKAFVGKVNVGVISAKDESYDHDNWWRSSSGVRTVLSETVGYIYSSFWD